MNQSETPVCGVRLQPRDRADAWHSRYCDRPATEDMDGKKLCKRHAAVQRKRKEKDQQWREGYDADTAYKERVQRLAAETGVPVRSVYSLHKYKHDRIDVPLEWFEQLTRTATEHE